MLDVRMGDRGPRVVLLQVLLNRRGAGLRVDGAFGPATGRAVADARARLFSGSGQIADPDLWNALFAEQQLCGVDAFDMGEDRLATGAGIVRSAGSRVVETGAMCDGVGAVVQGIVGRVRPPGSLAVLRTWAHGNHGRWLVFTAGEVVHTSAADPALGAQIAAERGSYIDAGNLTAMAPVMEPVGRCFAGVGIYEHHGCSLGSVAATRGMLQRLAHLWDVPVTVAMGTQAVPFTSAQALRYQGQTHTAYPGGSETAWIARVLGGERTSR